MKLWLDKKTEKAFIKYLNSKEICTPAETHTLASGLLESHRKAITERNHKISLFEPLANLMNKYGSYVERYEKRFKAKESPEIFRSFTNIISKQPFHSLINRWKACQYALP